MNPCRDPEPVSVTFLSRECSVSAITRLYSQIMASLSALLSVSHSCHYCQNQPMFAGERGDPVTGGGSLFYKMSGIFHQSPNGLSE